jgi:hypothetical protein
MQPKASSVRNVLIGLSMLLGTVVALPLAAVSQVTLFHRQLRANILETTALVERSRLPELLHRARTSIDDQLEGRQPGSSVHSAVKSAYQRDPKLFADSATPEQYGRVCVDLHHSTMVSLERDVVTAEREREWNKVVERAQGTDLGRILRDIYDKLASDQYKDSADQSASRVLFVYTTTHIDGTPVNVVYPGIYVPFGFDPHQRPWSSPTTTIAGSFKASSVYRDYLTNRLILTFEDSGDPGKSATRVHADITLDASGYISGVFLANGVAALFFLVVFIRLNVRVRHAFLLWLSVECACLIVIYTILLYNSLAQVANYELRLTVEMVNKFIPSSAALLAAASTMWTSHWKKARVGIVVAVAITEIALAFSPGAHPFLPIALSAACCLGLGLSIALAGHARIAPDRDNSALSLHLAVLTTIVACTVWGVSQFLLICLYPELSLTQWLRVHISNIWPNVGLYMSDVGVFSLLLATKILALGSLAFVATKLYAVEATNGEGLSPHLTAHIDSAGHVLTVLASSGTVELAPSQDIRDVIRTDLDKKELAHAIEQGITLRQFVADIGRRNVYQPMLIQVHKDWSHANRSVLHMVGVDARCHAIQKTAIDCLLRNSVDFQAGGATGALTGACAQLLRDIIQVPLPRQDPATVSECARSMDDFLHNRIVGRSFSEVLASDPDSGARLLRIRPDSIRAIAMLLQECLSHRSAERGVATVALEVRSELISIFDRDHEDLPVNAHRHSGIGLRMGVSVRPSCSFGTAVVDLAKPYDYQSLLQQPSSEALLQLVQALCALEDGTLEVRESRNTARLVITIPLYVTSYGAIPKAKVKR